jgi:SAM-dependent methyltransferase/acyl carrier protein
LAPVALDAVRARLHEQTTPQALQADLRARGVELGPRFQVLSDIRHGGDEALARLDGRPDVASEIDPALLDGCSALHALLDGSAGLRMQTRIGAIEVLASPREARWVYMQRQPGGTATDTLLLDDAGRVLIRIAGQHLEHVEAPVAAAGLSLYELDWVAEAPRTGATDQDAAAYDAAERELEALSTDYARTALRELGVVAPTPAGTVPRGVASRHAKLFQRLCELVPDSALAASHETLTARVRDARRRHPLAAPEFELLERCGSHLAAVLRNAIDPLTLLFPRAESAATPPRSASALYSESHAAVVMHARMRTTVAALLSAERGGRPLRVLEIGAGSGATTQELLGLLPADAEYWFTDVAPIFLQQARARLSDARLRFQPFDIEREAGDQQIPEESFDLVVASNVLHATRSLAATAANVRRLLRPGGSLVLLEGTTPRAWVDLIFGLTDGWWLFADADLRPRHPLVSAADWRALLVRAGFDVAEGDATGTSPAGQTLLVATRAVSGAGSRASADGPVARSTRQPWLILGDDHSAGPIATALRQRGAACDVVTGSLREAITRRGDNPPGILVLPTQADAEDADPAAVALREAGRATRLIQNVASAGAPCPIWFVTRDVYGAGNIAQAPIWGLARTLALEEPALAGGVIDIDGHAWAEAADLVAREVTESRAERQVVYRDGVRFVPRVRAVTAHASAPLSLADGAYLITGGLGALGLATAEHLAHLGATRLYLVGRHGAATPAARAALARLEARGVTAVVVAADVTNAGEMRAVIDAAQACPLPLRGVIHAAGVTGYGHLRETADSTLAEILQPKVTGAWLLHTLTQSLDLRFFVCYSSMVSVWGARGQGPYVAANHVLDVLARHRRAIGLPAVTINWGPLSGGGMVPEDVATDLLRMGVRTTPMHDAVAVLDRVLEGACAQPIAVDIDWHRFREAYATRGLGATFDLVCAAPVTASVAAAAPAQAAGREAVLRALPAQQRDVLLEELRALLRRVIATSGPIDAAAGLFDLGLDSLSSMELRRLLEQAFGMTLPATILFDCATLEALTADMAARLGLSVPASDSALDRLSDHALEAQLLAKLQGLN